MRNFKAAIDMFGRVAEVAEAEGHHPDLHLTGYNAVSIELTTHAVGAHFVQYLAYIETGSHPETRTCT